MAQMPQTLITVTVCVSIKLSENRFTLVCLDHKDVEIRIIALEKSSSFAQKYFSLVVGVKFIMYFVENNTT